MNIPNNDPYASLPRVPIEDGAITGNQLWQDQRAIAMQVALACQVYFSEFGTFPRSLEDVLEIYDHIPSEQRNLKRMLKFNDPSNGQLVDWLYYPNSGPETSDTLLKSPKSEDDLQIICSASGIASIVRESSS